MPRKPCCARIPASEARTFAPQCGAKVTAFWHADRKVLGFFCLHGERRRANRRAVSPFEAYENEVGEEVIIMLRQPVSGPVWNNLILLPGTPKVQRGFLPVFTKKFCERGGGGLFPLIPTEERGKVAGDVLPTLRAPVPPLLNAERRHTDRCAVSLKGRIWEKLIGNLSRKYSRERSRRCRHP